jgi:DNA repair protein RadA/Sms
VAQKPKRAAKAKTIFLCIECGDDQPRWFGRCPTCGAWNTAHEETRSAGASAAAGGPGGESAPRGSWVAAGSERGVPRPLAQLSADRARRVTTGIPEVDRVLGGGLVAGGILLLGGDPGIGKSTLALQVASALAAGGARVLYLSGEESPEQVRLRAARLGALPDSLFVLSETELESALAAAEGLQPAALIVDSIQTVASRQVAAGPGSVSQVRECALGFLAFAKGRRVPTILVGHVTKDGAVAGPRVLEHMVDAVLYLEGERYQELRILRAAKNRFGSTQELGVFAMTEGGLVEVAEPSRAFLGEQAAGPGSAAVVAMQGTRPLVVEVQALVSPTTFPMAQRAATGFPAKRLAVLLAVLEKRAGVRFSSADVFVSVAGGLRLEEPAADLGIALALAGSRQDRAGRSRLVALGEIGLAGEVRRVSRLAERVREAKLLGFAPILVPDAQRAEPRLAGDDVIGVRDVGEALDKGLEPRRPPRRPPEPRDPLERGDPLEQRGDPLRRRAPLAPPEFLAQAEEEPESLGVEEEHTA